jgi:hypothetical protein
MKYDITAEIILSDGSCSVDHYEVWDRFGQRTVAKSETLENESCSASESAEIVAHVRKHELHKIPKPHVHDDKSIPNREELERREKDEVERKQE